MVTDPQDLDVLAYFLVFAFDVGCIELPFDLEYGSFQVRQRGKPDAA